jgi:hypothetical protein
MSKKEADLFELYAEDPEKADRVVFGRVANPDRRGFLKGAGLATMAAALGGYIRSIATCPPGSYRRRWRRSPSPSKARTVLRS